MKILLYILSFFTQKKYIGIFHWHVNDPFSENKTLSDFDQNINKYSHVESMKTTIYFNFNKNIFVEVTLSSEKLCL